MNQQCVSIRAKAHPGERCPFKAHAGSSWCGHHGKQKSPVRWTAPATPEAPEAAARRIVRCCRRWLARRCGPLLWFREESTNPYDFFSMEPVTEIAIADFVSFVSDGKAYCMDIKSINSLLDYAKRDGTEPKNPYNRTPLPPLLLRRLQHHTVGRWERLKGLTPEQTFELDVTDVFRTIEDLGYYTDPQWFMTLQPVGLQRMYIELTDIWFHRANLSVADQRRIVPSATPRMPFRVHINEILYMTLADLRRLVLDVCRLLVTSALARSDKQLGAMYVLGALTLIHRPVRQAIPWLHDMFAPPVTTLLAPGIIQVAHVGILGY